MANTSALSAATKPKEAEENQTTITIRMIKMMLKTHLLYSQSIRRVAALFARARNGSRNPTSARFPRALVGTD
jgi:hypothetical protein